jgi:hypothetical protein
MNVFHIESGIRKSIFNYGKKEQRHAVHRAVEQLIMEDYGGL